MSSATETTERRHLSLPHVPSMPASRRAARQLGQRFMRWGLDSLADDEVVKLLFSLVSPYSEYKKQVMQLIKQFSSLRGLIEAPLEELQESGIAPEAILLVKLVAEIPTRIFKQKATDKPVYQSSQAIFDYLYYSMRGLRNEVFKVIHLNGRDQIINTADLFKGTADYIPIIPRQIIESAIRCKAISVIYAHNHPSGDPVPSKSDRRLTRDLVFIGSATQIRVLDHIIVGDNIHFSFADEGLIQKYEDNYMTLRMKADI